MILRKGNEVNVTRSDYAAGGMVFVYGFVGWVVKNPDTAITRTVGLLTALFILLKIVHFVYHWSKPPKKDE